MARFKADLSAINDIAEKLKMLGDVNNNGVTEKILGAGAEIAVNEWKTGVQGAGHVDTGAMLNSVKARTEGNISEIYPQGKDKKGVRNAEKAFILHYGNSDKLGDRFVDDIEKEIENKAPEVMQEAFEKYLEERGFL